MRKDEERVTSPSTSLHLGDGREPYSNSAELIGIVCRRVCEPFALVPVSPRRRSFGLRTHRIRVDVMCLYVRVTSLMELIPFVTI